MPTPPIPLKMEIPQAQLEAVKKRVDKWKGAPLAVRSEKATRAGMGLFVGPMKFAAPGPGHERPPADATGNLRGSIGVRKLKTRPGELAAYVAGPISRRRGQHRHLVIEGHRMVTHKPRQRVVGFVPGNPFVAQVRGQYGSTVVHFIDTQIRRLA